MKEKKEEKLSRTVRLPFQQVRVLQLHRRLVEGHVVANHPLPRHPVGLEACVAGEGRGGARSRVGGEAGPGNQLASPAQFRFRTARECRANNILPTGRRPLDPLGTSAKCRSAPLKQSDSL